MGQTLTIPHKSEKELLYIFIISEEDQVSKKFREVFGDREWKGAQINVRGASRLYVHPSREVPFSVILTGHIRLANGEQIENTALGQVLVDGMIGEEQRMEFGVDAKAISANEIVVGGLTINFE